MSDPSVPTVQFPWEIAARSACTYDQLAPTYGTRDNPGSSVWGLPSHSVVEVPSVLVVELPSILAVKRPTPHSA
jgi:hypothetical protein